MELRKLNEETSELRIENRLNIFYCVTLMWGEKYILTRVFETLEQSVDYTALVSQRSDLTVRCFEKDVFPEIKFRNVVEISLTKINIPEIIEMFDGILDFTKIEFEIEQLLLEELLDSRLEAGNINETIDMLSTTSRYHILLSDFLKVDKLVVCSVWKRGDNKVYRYPQIEEDIIITFKIKK